MTTLLREGLPPMPERMRALPIEARGFPVPFFVDWIDGVPDFRVVDDRKLYRCVRERLCWLCGQRLGRFHTYVIGPMCAVNRISSEPPSHQDCAAFAAKACPWMTRPHAQRREANIPAEAHEPAGFGLKRNPGVAMLWTTRDPVSPVRAHGGNEGWLFRVGEPVEVACYAEGRLATPEEIRASVESGLPLLREPAAQEGPHAVAALENQIAVGLRVLGLAA